MLFNYNSKIRCLYSFYFPDKPKVIEVPNQCPFKENILKEVENMKKEHEDAKEKVRQKRREELAKTGLTGLVSIAESKGAQHEASTSMEVDTMHEKIKEAVTKEENSLKAYYKEFRKVLNAADVILEVVDARDPLGTRCEQVRPNMS